jgi:hypothetical protein
MMEQIIQTEVPTPSYRVIAEQIVSLIECATDRRLDQETIRAALGAFAQVASFPSDGRLGPLEPKRCY